MISARWTRCIRGGTTGTGCAREARGRSLVCRCPVPVCPCWPDSARPLSRKSLEMARCRGRWSDFWQTPDPPPACDTPMAWNYPAMIGRLPRCLRRGPQGKKERHSLTLARSHARTLTQRGQGALPREEPPVLQPATLLPLSAFSPAPLSPAASASQKTGGWISPPPQSTYLRVCISMQAQVSCLYVRYLAVPGSQTPSGLSDALGLCGMASPTGKISPFSSDKPRAAACSAHEFLNNLTIRLSVRPSICLSIRPNQSI